MSKRTAYRLLGALAALIVAIVSYLAGRPSAPVSSRGPSGLRPALETPSAPAVASDAREAQAIKPAPNGLLLLPEAADLARTLNAPEGSAEQDRQTLTTLVDLFRRANHGAIPAGGLNEEIIGQMLGKNAQHVAVLPPDCPGLDVQGRLRDRWGTPYFLHPLSREILEIRSAGPDRKFGTEDDVSDPTVGAEIQR